MAAVQLRAGTAEYGAATARLDACLILKGVDRPRMVTMASSRQEWQGLAIDCARSLVLEEGPVSFLVGAGASLSSGAPSTPTVLRALTSATSGRIRSREVRALIDRIGERDKQNILRGLFRGARPYIGYLSLAALGRHRRVIVANLNWDPLVQQACAELQVPCVAFDLVDGAQWQTIEQLPPDVGVVDVHIHGMLGVRSAIASLETLSFTPGEEEFLASLVWANPTVIVGASLVEDTDLEAMFRRLGRVAESAAPCWLFARHGGNLPLPSTSMAAEHLAQWPLNSVASDSVDFDELVVTILAEQLGFGYESLRELRPTANLPLRENLVYPDPALIRDSTLSRTIVLSGEPKLGKTTLAYLLAWWRVLWTQPRGLEAAAVRGALGGYEDAATALAALATQGDDPTAGAATVGKSVLVLDDPYGQDSQAPNPLFITQLTRVTSLPTAPTVVVSTREPGWLAALRAQGISAEDLSARGIVCVSTDVARWWSKSVLLGMAAHLPNAEELQDGISSGRLNTPGRVLEYVWISSTRRAARLRPTHDTEVTASKELLIALVPELARGCALARFQEFCYEPLTVTEFEEVLGAPIGSVPGLAQMLIRYDFEDKPRIRLAHPTYREAIDSYLLDPAKSEEVTDWLLSRPFAGEGLLSAIRAYSFVQSVIANPDTWIYQPIPADASEWAPQILAASQTEATISALRAMDWDLWTGTELAYELIRLYPDIRNRGGHEFVREMLANDAAFGAYAILEACLYLRSSATDEVWTALKARLYELIARPGGGGDASGVLAASREEHTALVIDGLLWRPPPAGLFSGQFVRAAFEDVTVSDRLWALLRFAGGYHPGGLAALQVDDLLAADQEVALTDEQVEFVAWLMRWHFVHQSRARAILARQPYVDQDFLCRSLHAAPVDGSARGLRRLMSCLLSRPSTAGWVLHLGCNLLSIGVAVDDECRGLMRRSMDMVEDGDLGVVTCALTYAAAAQFADVLRPYFARPVNRDALLDAAFEGPIVNGIRIKPPRFVCARPPGVIQAELNLRWPRLHEAGFDASDPERVVRQLRDRAETLISQGKLDGKLTDQLLARVRRGDLRILEQAVSAREAPDNIADHLLQVGTFALQEPDRLF
jgi:hypothetical protein